MNGKNKEYTNSNCNHSKLNLARDHVDKTEFSRKGVSKGRNE